jgi:hypothetical protein
VSTTDSGVEKITSQLELPLIASNKDRLKSAAGRTAGLVASLPVSDPFVSTHDQLLDMPATPITRIAHPLVGPRRGPLLTQTHA